MNDTTRRAPAYLIIADELRNRIEQRQLRGGDRLPTERDLVEEFGVARMTVRHALDILQLEGLIERRRGRTGGTFVRDNPPVVELTRMENLGPQLRDRGSEVRCEVLEATATVADTRISEKLRIDEGAPVYRVLRLLIVDDVPLTIEDTCFPAELLPGLLNRDVSCALYHLLESGWGIRPVRKSETITPGVASSREQQLLKVTRNLPLLRISRVAYDADGVPVEYSEDVMRSDIANIRVVTDTIRPD